MPELHHTGTDWDSRPGDAAAGHEHTEFTALDAARIGVAAISAIALWFVEATFLTPGSFFGNIRAFFLALDPWPALPLGELLPEALGNRLPGPFGGAVDLPFSTFAAVGLVFSGWPIFREALDSLRQRKMTMELSMTIAIVAAAYTAHFFVAMIIVFFVLIAEALENLTVERGRRAIRELLEFLPRTVRVRRGGAVVEAETDDLAVGEVVLVAPGARIPVDGSVVAGATFVDESRITGESMPVEKMAGGRVFAGSVNQSGVIEVTTERIGADTSYGKIIDAVERAETSRAPVTRIADRLAGYIVLVAVALAAWAQFRFGDVDTSISVLVVAGACGVAAGVPLAILGAIGRAAHLGAIVKGGVHMEALIRVNTVVFDKTGTLTLGVPQVQEARPAPAVSRSDLLAAAAGAEFGSEHPLGKAIIAAARAEGITVTEPDTFRYVPGRGIAATVSGAPVLVGNLAWLRDNGIGPGEIRPATGAATTVHIAQSGRYLGAIAIADTLRPEAKSAVAAIKALGIRTILLTGDHPDVARSIGNALDIPDVEAELLPEQKVERVRALVTAGRTVAMVGDGVNDAPALAAANVGVAMGSGTDVARESADVVLLGNNLNRFADTLKLARWTNTIILENFAGTIVIGIAGIALAFLGIIGPVIAVQIHTFSELLFILNSARVLVNVGAELRAVVAGDPLLARLFRLRPEPAAARPAGAANPSPVHSWRKVPDMVPLYALRPAFTPLTILVMIVAFILYWPLGLLVLAYILLGDRVPEIRRFFEEHRDMGGTGGGGTSWRRSAARPAWRSGNLAFDEYRERELTRLEEERAHLEREREEFEEYVRNLHRARDQEEFDRFRRERENRTSPPL